MINNRIIAGLITICLATSCSQSLSRSEKASLTAVRIPEGKTRPEGYNPPQSITQGSAQAIGFVSGLTFGLVGGVVAAAGVAAKQHGFESKHKSDVELIKAGTPTDLGKMVAAELNTQLGSDPFFGPRLKANGAAGRIEIEVTNYTLLKVSSELHSPAVAVFGKIVGPNGEDYYKAAAMATGDTANANCVPGCCASMANYASNPTLLRTHYQQVAAQAARNLAKTFKEAAED